MRVRTWWMWIGVVAVCAYLAAVSYGPGAKKTASPRERDPGAGVAASSGGQGVKKAMGPREWDQWRGPNRDGSCSETDWSCKWPDIGPREVWRIKLGPGYSQVTVRGGLLYTNGGAFKDEAVYCLNARNGTEVWRFVFPRTEASGQKWTRGAYTTPAVDGQLVFAQSLSGYVAALDADSGRMVWGRDLIAEAGKTPPLYGCASSPLVLDGLVIVSGAVGIEKTTGRIVWKSQNVPAFYPSPVSMTTGQQHGVVFVSDRFVCVNASSGELLWEIPRGAGNFYIDPVVWGDRVLFWNSLYKIADGKPSRVYCTSYSPDAGSMYCSPIIRQGYVFRLSSALECRDLGTGQLKWTQEGLSGTMTLGDSRLIILTKDGQLVVADASTEAYRELARFRVFQEEGFLKEVGVWSPPVLFDGRLYLRNYGELVCLDLRK